MTPPTTRIPTTIKIVRPGLAGQRSVDALMPRNYCGFGSFFERNFFSPFAITTLS